MNVKSTATGEDSTSNLEWWSVTN